MKFVVPTPQSCDINAETEGDFPSSADIVFPSSDYMNFDQVSYSQVFRVLC
jgi:hypothetical protein